MEHHGVVKPRQPFALAEPRYKMGTEPAPKRGLSHGEGVQKQQ